MAKKRARVVAKSQSINAKRVDPEAALERSKARKRFIDDALASSGTGITDEDGNLLPSENYAGLEKSRAHKQSLSDGGGQKKG